MHPQPLSDADGQVSVWVGLDGLETSGNEGGQDSYKEKEKRPKARGKSGKSRNFHFPAGERRRLKLSLGALGQFQAGFACRSRSLPPEVIGWGWL